MTDLLPFQILSSADGPAAEVVNPDGLGNVCLVCEHASAAIPASLQGLGLRDADRLSHAAWDPGAADLAHMLSEMLDAPLVLARISRLVHDCNRPPERADATPTRSETIEIPGNKNLSAEERAARTREVYDAFHETLTHTLERFATPPALVTVHSFTPSWFGEPRPTEIGLLHDADPRMARNMLNAAQKGRAIALNKPYAAADGVTHMLARHAVPRDLSNVMIEVRNDLLANEAGVRSIARILHPMITSALSKGSAA